MIRRALELCEPLDTYATKLKVSVDTIDQEVYNNDYLLDAEWRILKVIKEQLEPLFLLTKELEGNADLREGVYKALYGSL